MDTSRSQTLGESRWWFYLLAVAFLCPGLAVWEFAVIYLYPKVQVIWREGGAVGSEAQWLMNVADRLIEHGWLALLAIVVTLALVEVRATAGATYRRVVIGSAVVLLNSVVLAGLATLCILTLFAAPGLRVA